MIVSNVIAKKRDKGRLTAAEIDFMVQGYALGEIPDYQMAAFLMALYIQGVDREETVNFAESIIASGRKLDLSPVPGVKVDKHSTGGVGDKTTLVLVPLVAAAGVPIAKLSGRSLGHTGGTLDKLESIPGFNVNLSSEELVKQLKDIGMAIAEAGKEIVPADKKIYALRDVTATISSIPLIASSIMGKKVASGADKIVLDVKVGSGAFSKTLEDALELATQLVSVGSALGKEAVAIISDMNQPLGYAVGNSLEVKEAIETLKGTGPKDLEELCLILGSHLIFLGRVSPTLEEARKVAERMIPSGAALKKFTELVEAQGGDPNIINNTELLPRAKIVHEYPAPASGYIYGIETQKVGEAALLLGAGRLEKETPIEHAVGFIFRKKIGDQVQKSEPLVEVHANDEEKIKEALAYLSEAIAISDKKPPRFPLIYKTIV